jgi:hypothetical protein
LVHSSLPFFLVFVRSFQREVQPPWPGQSAIRSCRPMSLRSTPPMAAVCPLRYRDAQLPSLSLPHRQADMVEGCPSTKPRPFALPLGRFLRPMSDVTLPMRSCLRHRSPMRSKARPGNARERRDDAFNVIRHVGLPALPYLLSFTETRSGRQDDTIEGDGPRRSSVDATRAPNSSRFYSVRFRSGSRTGCAFPRQGGSAAKELPL